MLSKETVKLLATACEASHRLFDQGGLIYLYTFGYGRAHSYIDRSILNADALSTELDVSEYARLGVFFENAMVRPFSDNVSPKTKAFVSELVVCLSRDFGEMLTLTYFENNNFHSLELDWSID
jgi:hypothetical protein